MRTFAGYLGNYLRNLPIKTLLFTLLFVALLVVVNYTTGIERRIRAITPWYNALGAFFLFYSLVFLISWAIQYKFDPKFSVAKDSWRPFLFLWFLGPAFFACKMVHWNLFFYRPDGALTNWEHYTQVILQLPAKLLLLFILLWLGWRAFGSDTQSGAGISWWPAWYGLTTKGFRAAPYFAILACMIPLVALASTRPDFLHTYPKVKNIAWIAASARPVWPWQLLYEISYGLDFLNIELFFRGLLAIGLARYAGDQVILPMAAFYCTIHFGKPLGECISSFFGGLVLGVLALRSRSILGGVIVHLGLAWMMELGGWIGNMFH